MGVYLTSDTHFYHKRVIEYCNRPFSSVEEMNESLINNWNNTVRDEDTIYHLGDVFFGGTTTAIEILKRLKGIKKLVLGNHDMRNKNTLKRYFDIIPNFSLFSNNSFSFKIDHYHDHIIPKDNNGNYEFFLLHGHSHSIVNNHPNKFDVGVDANNYTPVSLDYIVEYFNKKRKEEGLIYDN